MRPRPRRVALAAASVLALSVLPGPASPGPPLPLLGRWDFESGDAAGWSPRPAASWRVETADGSRVYALTAPGTSGRFRAPTAWSLAAAFDVGAFELSGRFRSTADPANPLGDLCVLFDFRDAERFSYVHFAGASDEVHNIVGRVAGADRVKVNREPAGGSTPRLVDRRWHRFRVEGDPRAGEVRAYVDDLERPILVAPRAAGEHGLVGVGSFDDTGEFDDLELRGAPPERPRAKIDPRRGVMIK